MDKAKLIAAIVQKHKVRLDEDDPAFILVDLNQIALDEAVQKMAMLFSGLASEIESARSEMDLQARAVVDAGKQHEKLIHNLVDESKRNFLKAAELAKQSQLHNLKKAMSETAGEALQETINFHVGDALEAVEKASRLLAASASNVNSSSKNLQSMTKYWMIIAPLAALTAVMILLGGQWYFGRAQNQVEQLTVDQKRQLEIGKNIEKVWSSLDPITQNKLQAAFNKDAAKSK